ncbi:hypothetical protein GCM10010116_51940 [Microbispora rosea subsp. aerata]|nr:hypothetical protein [Microbispora rosea]GGO25875.1 hypothetical protein GCM10010116_51940 [Microbispora rosea subsp. aerata]GIH56937.1 hypothetical protein Mro02_38510 [Microbispora rosea subsp. aerata]GLJ82862.1 hypothetical protein GCM10017588_15880 [Microbispora rosea subsp. aerata]
MPKFNNLVGILAISAALTGGAVTLGTAVATSANAATVMGGYVGGGGYPYPYNANYNRNRNKQGQKHRAANKNKNKNKNKTKQWQHERQNQNQHQFLLRDFTLVLTPFQKTDTDARALPYNWQYGSTQAYPYTRTDNFSDQYNRPHQDQESAVRPKSNQATEVNPEVEEKTIKEAEKAPKKKHHAPIPEDDNVVFVP